MAHDGGRSREELERIIDALADGFESAWLAGEPLRIEDVSADRSDVDRTALLRELLISEWELRGLTNDDKDAVVEEYSTRFPDFAELIETLFRERYAAMELENYVLLEEIGRGGMGILYRARQKRLEKIVAVKVLAEHLTNDPEIQNRFLREMRLIGRLNHPNIVQAIATEKLGYSFCLVMEYVDGRSLRDVVKQDGPLPPERSLEIVRQAASGLQHAFEQGIVHRDVKPGNLMLSQDGTVKILDFGLGKFAGERHEKPDSDVTQHGAVLGTLDYLSPEQRRDAATADIRSDVYGLGCTLHFLLTGEAPFDDDENIPAEVKRLLARMTAQNPEGRFQAPDELLDAIDAMLRRFQQRSQRRAVSRRFFVGAMILAGIATLLIGAFVFRETDDVDTGENAEILQYPGAGGRGWYEDALWLTPERRLEIITQKRPATFPDAGRENLGPDDFAGHETDASAERLHAHAARLHRQAMRECDANVATQAENFYDRAVEKYDATKETGRLLRNLCLFDRARLLLWRDDDAQAFEKQISDIPVTQADALTFRTERDAALGEALFNAGRSGDHCFADAFHLLENAEQTDVVRDRLRQLYERYGAALLARWRTGEAEAAFDAALRLLKDDDVAGKFRIENARLKILQRQGRLDQLQQRYWQLSGGLERLPGGETFVPAVRGHMYQMLADATFYRGDLQAQTHEHHIDVAEDLYYKAALLLRDDEEQCILACKRVILNAISGYGGFAAELFSQLESPKSPGFRQGRSQSPCFRIVAQAVMRFCDTQEEPDPQKRRQELRAAVDALKFNLTQAEQDHDERLALQLLCAKLLIESSLDADDRETARLDMLTYLNPVLQKLSARRSLRPFLRPYYDLAIRTQLPDFPAKAVELILAVRMMAPQRDGDSQLVFYLTDSESYAFFVDGQSRETFCYDLACSRRDVLLAKTTQALPQELVEHIRTHRDEGEKIELFWTDDICWEPDDQLTLLDWPFEEQLPVESFVGTIR